MPPKLIEPLRPTPQLGEPSDTSTSASPINSAGVFTSLAMVVLPAISGCGQSHPANTKSQVQLDYYDFHDMKVDLCIKALQHEHYQVRADAAAELSTMYARANPAIPALTEALYDERFAVRAWAMTALGRTHNPIVVPSLIAALDQEGSGTRCWFAVEALGVLGPLAVEAVPALCEALSDPDFDVREQAAIALQKIGDPRACGPLRERINVEKTAGPIWAMRDALKALENR